MQTHTFDNGLRVIFEHKDSDVVYCGYVICAGTRHEESADSGMAHFIEHMSFKGTERRRSYHINNGLERVGGDLNAFTNKQETVYYATVLSEDFPRAVDILTDLVFHSTYPQAEIDKEVEVIADEIESYLDSPAELIFDDFEAMLFEGNALGRDILGRAERLREYTTADARRFVDTHYRPDNAVFYVTGNLDWKRVLRELNRWSSPMSPVSPIGSKRLISPMSSISPIVPSTRIIEKGTHQAHVVVGAPTFGGHEAGPKRYAIVLLNNILGGPGMNSRLNMSLREHAGLVYSIDSYLTTYPDAGWWCVYFGCDIDDVDRCLRLVRKELQRLATAPLSAARLAAAKKQIIGQLTIADNNAESYALALGKQYAHYNTQRSSAAIVEGIRAVTAEDILQLAAEIYAPERISTLIYK
ncbi:MAG: pitrilysin family protein [Bacteroidales bacterium]|nr:pitrilysin family protein [Bacteroidales bacterium]